eukprot:GHVH01012685.1.p1 GENE.GHVH01012685.1~~GHVH01012685.1.p1  ORF type:complete len:234 (-),score=27.62 GHVH01012685.1:333-1034(-)
MSLSIVLQEYLVHHNPDESISTIERMVKDYSIILNNIREMRPAGNGPVILGISAHQGAGKTTLLNLLTDVFKKVYDESVVGFSLDDFYYDFDDLANIKAKIAEELDGSPVLYKYRGNCGTHDELMLTSVLRTLKEGGRSLIPRYDKALHGGLGGRAEKSKWEVVIGKQDWIVVDSWNLSHQHLDKSTLQNNLHNFEALSAERGFPLLFTDYDLSISLWSHHCLGNLDLKFTDR